MRAPRHREPAVGEPLTRLGDDPRSRPFVIAAAAILGFTLTSHPKAQTSDAGAAAAALFEQRCAACHANPTQRAPTRAALSAMSPSLIVDSLAHGLMKAQGSALAAEQRVALAEYLTGRKVGDEASTAGKCAAASSPLSLDGPSFNGWGGNVENWRFQPDPGLTAADLPRLKLKWAFGVPGAILMFG